jgi:hypothetical protein
MEAIDLMLSRNLQKLKERQAQFTEELTANLTPVDAAHYFTPRPLAGPLTTPTTAPGSAVPLTLAGGGSSMQMCSTTSNSDSYTTKKQQDEDHGGNNNSQQQMNGKQEGSVPISPQIHDRENGTDFNLLSVAGDGSGLAGGCGKRESYFSIENEERVDRFTSKLRKMLTRILFNEQAEDDEDKQ